MKGAKATTKAKKHLCDKNVMVKIGGGDSGVQERGKDWTGF